jgi:hypothetical protein
MRSRAERALRVASFALIAFTLWRMATDGGAGGTVTVRASALSRELPSLEASRTAALHVVMDAMPSPAERDELGAVAHAGTRVTWGAPAVPRSQSTQALANLALVASRGREPGDPARVTIVSNADVTIADSLAPLDSLRAASTERGVTIDVPSLAGALGARSGTVRAPVGVPEATALHPVLVVGRAGWEAKFAVAALEELGWRVEARLFVAPGADVMQGAIAVIDTNRYAAIVAVDTTLGPAGASIARFVRAGGGLVLLAGAANAPAVRAIAPARAGIRKLAATRSFDVAEPVNAMPVYPLLDLRADAVPLSSRGSLITGAARREGAGRVLQLGFDETWRWRMQGGADGVAKHRAWWSRVVASVAATPLASVAESPSAEGAPLARLVEALGPPLTAAPGSVSTHELPWWLLPALLLTLLAEWGSRRWRGAR